MSSAKKQKHEPQKVEHKNKSTSQKKNVFSHWLVVGVIAIVTFIVFSPSLKCDFTDWDDPGYVLKNSLVVNNSIPVKEIFKTPIALNYHPFTILTLAWNYQSGKLNARVYHLWNVVLHVLNTILAFFFVFLLTKRNILMAAIVALFFGIHPMHVESVAWISERKDVLYVFFLLGGLISYLKFREKGNYIYYLITLILFVSSCLSKAMAVVFPVLLFLIDYLLFEKKGETKKWWNIKSILEKVPFLLISLGFGFAAYKIQQGGAMNLMQYYSPLQRLLFASYGAVMYVVKLIVPYGLSAFYPYPASNATQSLPLIIYLSPILFLGSAGMIYYFFRKQKAVVFGFLFYFVSVALVLQFISVGSVVMADRYSYLSYIGLLFVAAYGADYLFKKNNYKLPVSAVLIIVALMFSIQTYSFTKVWTNSETLWTNAIDKDPEHCYTGYNNRGWYYYDIKNNPEKAIADYNKAIEANPAYSVAYSNRGKYYNKLGKNDLALDDFNKSIHIDSSAAIVFLNRGAVYSELGKTDLALADFAKSIRMDTQNPEVYYNRGRLYSFTKQNDLAIADYTRAIEINPGYALAYNNRAIVYGNAGQDDLSMNDYNKAIELDSKLEIAFCNRGSLYYKKEKYDLALSDYTSAISLNPNVHEYWYGRSITESALGKMAEAQTDMQKARELGMK